MSPSVHIVLSSSAIKASMCMQAHIHGGLPGALHPQGKAPLPPTDQLEKCPERTFFLSYFSKKIHVIALNYML